MTDELELVWRVGLLWEHGESGMFEPLAGFAIEQDAWDYAFVYAQNHPEQRQQIAVLGCKLGKEATQNNGRGATLGVEGGVEEG